MVLSRLTADAAEWCHGFQSAAGAAPCAAACAVCTLCAPRAAGCGRPRRGWRSLSYGCGLAVTADVGRGCGVRQETDSIQ